MQASMRSHQLGRNVAGSRSIASVKPASQVLCQAGSPATAWSAWESYMGKRAKGVVLSESKKESKLFDEITKEIAKASVGHKPRFSQHHESQGGAFKLQHVNKVKTPPKELPKDLHDKLEAIGVSTLKTALDLDGELDYANVSFTTTDIDAALSITGTVVQKGSDKNAVVVMVVTETERQASWSRLEGLILHWACTSGPGGPWAMPPDGWAATPDKTRDAGGAIQCTFEKSMVGQETLYSLTLTAPLRGALKSGGLVFVLKGSAQKTDRWLKDSSTESDFFLELQRLPLTKL